MTDIPLNTYIEWTEADREHGEFPLLYGSDVTVWFSNGTVARNSIPQDWIWGDYTTSIIGYLVHELPREPIVAWIAVSGEQGEQAYRNWQKKEDAEKWVKEHGGIVVKMVEVDDD